MGDRRMVSRKIVESARFLKMPATSQNLYFHLVVNADDDGIVEAYSVLALTKANEDDLRVLVSKQFVYMLNEDLVAYIEDWLEMNYLRADRKKDSRYKPLLLQLRPDVKLIEAKERSDTKGGKKKCQHVDSPRTAQPNLIQSNLTESNLTEDKSINLSINQETNSGIDGVTDIENYKRIIAENIELNILYEMAKRQDEYEVSMVTEIYETICDMVTIPRDKVVIKQTEYPWSVVKSQFLKLKRVHVANILNRIVDADLKIKNMASYLISSLYTESISGTILEQAELYDDYLKYLRGNPYSV
ncbi:DUF6017 domain-containing protein [Blautia coccoides]|uniref:DUF6017 domain-containing protein n=1 Tax=Blautia producta TaxID=33035 RepID=A0ABZ0UHZ7_9FIRM|nr:MULTISPECIES: DUF6017 domain-containing protein [Blautia]MCR1988140.1 DUF6017 domain-containing protein [Blautia coccoides]TCO52730.1 hypothetical protein EV205_1432 [Blautia coccoides]WPX76493.1 hypothetical protein BLCOC_48790 [Blautia coccoides]SUY01960.1 replication initiation protein [Blautia coccoides]